jgi:hypothetical protein
LLLVWDGRRDVLLLREWDWMKASQTSMGDELLLTKLIFKGAFNVLAPEQCAGLLSCFVFSKKVRSSIVLRVEGVVTLFFAERTGDQVEGGNGGTSADDARDREAHRQGFQGI